MKGPVQRAMSKLILQKAQPTPAARVARAKKPLPPRLPDYLEAGFIKLDVPRDDWFKPSGRIIAFCHSLVVPAGKFVGQPLRLRAFQIDFIRDVYNPRREDGTRRRRQAILSVGRRAGKTLLAALIVLIHLVGPAKRMHSTIVSAATSRKQAGILFRFVAALVRANAKIRLHLKVIDSTKTVTHKADSSHYMAIAAEAGGQFGEGLDLVVYDELAQAKNPQLYDALMTSLGSQVEPLMMVISTQAPANDHILSELIDYGIKVQQGEIDDDTFAVHLYAATDNCDLLDEKEWHKANPTLGDYRDLDEFRTTMKRAEKVPSLEASVRNLYLNQRVQAKAPFLTPSVWKLGEKPTDERLLYDGRPVYGGLDLSARTDLSALVFAVEDDQHNIHLFPRIWTPDDTLDDRGLRDRAPYRAWARDELIIPVPGSALDYDWLATDIGDAVGIMNIQKIAYDRWRIDVLKQAFNRLGIAVPLTEFGQGYKDMAPAIDVFEELALSGRIFHGGHPVLRWAVSNAIIDRDPAGNRKLTKQKSFGRIDPAVAAVQAVAALKLQTENPLDVMALIG